MWCQEAGVLGRLEGKVDLFSMLEILKSTKGQPNIGV